MTADRAAAAASATIDGSRMTSHCITPGGGATFTLTFPTVPRAQFG